MDEERRRQFAHLATGKTRPSRLGRRQRHSARPCEVRCPFVETDHSTTAWLFYDTDVNAARFANSGLTTRVEQRFRSILASRGYPTDWLAAIAFAVDSHGNVERNFEGSYFYGLR